MASAASSSATTPAALPPGLTLADVLLDKLLRLCAQSVWNGALPFSRVGHHLQALVALCGTANDGSGAPSCPDERSKALAGMYGHDAAPACTDRRREAQPSSGTHGESPAGDSPGVAQPPLAAAPAHAHAVRQALAGLQQALSRSCYDAMGKSKMAARAFAAVPGGLAIPAAIQQWHGTDVWRAGSRDRGDCGRRGFQRLGSRGTAEAAHAAAAGVAAARLHRRRFAGPRFGCQPALSLPSTRLVTRQRAKWGQRWTGHQRPQEQLPRRLRASCCAASPACGSCAGRLWLMLAAAA